MKLLVKIKKFCHLESFIVNFPATQLRSTLPNLRTLRLLREQTIRKKLHKSKELKKKIFFQGVFPAPNSLHRQSQRHNFVLSKANDTNKATTRFHNHAVFSNEI